MMGRERSGWGGGGGAELRVRGGGVQGRGARVGDFT